MVASRGRESGASESARISEEPLRSIAPHNFAIRDRTARCVRAKEMALRRSVKDHVELDAGSEVEGNIKDRGIASSGGH